MKMNQQAIADAAGISASYFCQILKRKRIPPWQKAKQLAKTVQGTTPVMWIEGSENELRAAIEAANEKTEIMAA